MSSVEVLKGEIMDVKNVHKSLSAKAREKEGQIGSTKPKADKQEQREEQTLAALSTLRASTAF